METQNHNSGIAGELTATEVDLAVAEIADRLMRYRKAAFDLQHFDISQEELREKYNMPEGVFTMEECRSDTTRSLLMWWKKNIIRPWVMGVFCVNECKELLWFFESWDELDYGWIFMGDPLNFFPNLQTAEEQENYRQEHEKKNTKFISIGSRNRAKLSTARPWIPLHEQGFPITAEVQAAKANA